MNSVPDQTTGGHEVPDVADMPLAQLLASQDNALSNALQRYAREAEEPPQALSAFSSQIS